jgi:hypothetical protein
MALREVARDALAKIARLADVENGVAGVEEAVDAGQVRQHRDLGGKPLARCGALVPARFLDRLFRHRSNCAAHLRTPRRAGRAPLR